MSYIKIKRILYFSIIFIFLIQIQIFADEPKTTEPKTAETKTTETKTVENKNLESKTEVNITTLKKDWTNGSVMLLVNAITDLKLENNQNIALQIIKGKETANNKWEDIISGKDVKLLQKEYTYIVTENVVVSGRIIIWTKEDRSDAKQIAYKEFVIKNIDKVTPVLENVEFKVDNNKLLVNIKSTDKESGIKLYKCQLENGEVKENNEPKFEFNNLENNKEYNFTITVIDKVGNMKVDNRKYVYAENVPIPESTTQAVQENSTPQSNDSTLSNKGLPEVGKERFFIPIVLILGYVIIRNRKI